MTSPPFGKTYVSYLLWVGPMHRENNSKKFTVLLKDQLRQNNYKQEHKEYFENSQKSGKTKGIALNSQETAAWQPQEEKWLRFEQSQPWMEEA